MDLFGSAYVINLERSRDRWNTTSKLLNKANIPYQRFNAIDGSKLDMKTIKKFVNPMCYKFMCSNGIIGCAMSHYTIWKKIVDEKKPWGFVLEDDITVGEKALEVINKVQSLVKQYPDIFNKSVIRLYCLGNCYENSDNNINKIDGHSMYITNILSYVAPMLTKREDSKKILEKDGIEIHISQYPLSNAAYIIDYYAAKTMVDLIEKTGIKHHIDAMMSMKYDIKNYAVYPPVFKTRIEKTTLSNYTFPYVIPTIFWLFNPALAWIASEYFFFGTNVCLFFMFIVMYLLWVAGKYKLLRSLVFGLLLIESILYYRINILGNK